jgi:dienelactone hydrolase
MKRIGMVGLCLAAVLAMSAVVVASASAAAPEYGRCLKAEKIGKVYNGGYTNSSCTTASESKTGKYEWFPGVVKNKMTTSGGKALLETVDHLEVACTSETSVGEFNGAKEVKDTVVTFKGCEAT